MLRINLLPWREKKRAAEKRRDMIMAVLIIFLALAVIGGFYISASFYYKRGLQKVTLLEEKLHDLSKQVKKNKKVESQVKELIKLAEIIQQLQQIRYEGTYLFDELDNFIPKNVYLTKFEYDEGKISLTGQTNSNTNVVELMKNISSIKWLSETDLDEINRGEKGILFNLNMQLVWAEMEQETAKNGN